MIRKQDFPKSKNAENQPYVPLAGVDNKGNKYYYEPDSTFRDIGGEVPQPYQPCGTLRILEPIPQKGIPNRGNPLTIISNL